MRTGALSEGPDPVPLMPGPQIEASSGSLGWSHSGHPELLASGHPKPHSPSLGGLPQLAGCTGDPLDLPEVAKAGAEAADLLHVGLGHPALLAISQADALEPAWGCTGKSSVSLCGTRAGSGPGPGDLMMASPAPGSALPLGLNL